MMYRTKVVDSRVRGRSIAVLEALFVTVLWSSSWVIIKFGLEEIPPLLFSGLRYFIASLILLFIISSSRSQRDEVRSMGRNGWAKVIVYGIVFVTITQGAQFLGLSLLNAISVSILLNLTPIIVLFLAVPLLQERPSKLQALLVFGGFFGVVIYFYPIDIDFSQTLGLVIVLVGVVANAFSSILGRSINKEMTSTPLVVTGTSMVMGSVVLLLTAIVIEGIPTLSVLSVVYILWLSVVNTALAFTIWNRAMQTLRAIDMTIINSTMLPQIVVLSIIFLGETITLLDILGLALVAITATAVQVDQRRRRLATDL